MRNIYRFAAVAAFGILAVGADAQGYGTGTTSVPAVPGNTNGPGFSAGPAYGSSRLRMSGIHGVAMILPASTGLYRARLGARPLEGATIVVRRGSKNGPVELQTKADARGRFTALVRPGKYVVAALPPNPGDMNFIPHHVRVVVTRNKMAEIIVRMEPRTTL